MLMVMNSYLLLKYHALTMQLMRLIKKVHRSAGVRALLAIKESQEMHCQAVSCTTQKIEYLQRFTPMATQLCCSLQLEPSKLSQNAVQAKEVPNLRLLVLDLHIRTSSASNSHMAKSRVRFHAISTSLMAQ